MSEWAENEGQQVETKGILAEFQKRGFSERVIMRRIKEAVEVGRLTQIRKGAYESCLPNNSESDADKLPPFRQPYSNGGMADPDIDEKEADELWMLKRQWRIDNGEKGYKGGQQSIVLKSGKNRE